MLTQSFLMEGTKDGTGDVRTNSGAVPGFVTAFIFAVKRGKCLAGKKRKSHQTSEGRFLSKLCPHRVLCELELD